MFNVDREYVFIDPIIPFYTKHGYTVTYDTDWASYYPDLDRRAFINSYYQTFERAIDMTPNHCDVAIGTKILADQLPFRSAIAPIITLIDKQSRFYPKGGKKVPSLLLAGIEKSPVLVFTNHPVSPSMPIIKDDKGLYDYMRSLDASDDRYYVRFEQRHADIPMITYLETDRKLFKWKSKYRSTEALLRETKPTKIKTIGIGNVTCDDDRVDFCRTEIDESATVDVRRTIDSLFSDAECVIFSKAPINIGLSYIWLNSYNSYTESFTRFGVSNQGRPFDVERDQMVLYTNGTLDGPIMAAPLR